MASLPPLPASLKSLQHYLKAANEHDHRDMIVSYYFRLYTFQTGLGIDKKSPEAKKILAALMDYLEKVKRDNREQEALQNEIVGQAHIENYALKLFLHADNEDRAAHFDKNVVKTFYTAGLLFDILTTFGELSEEIEKNRKYAKWKAAYIHRCLKSGETPVPGPMGGDEEYKLDNGTYSDFQVPVPAPRSITPQPGPSLQLSNTVQPHAAPSPTLPRGPHVNSSGPSSLPSTSTWQSPQGSNTVSPELYQKAMKYTKFAGSALQYEDAPTAIDNLRKALNLLTVGHE